MRRLTERQATNCEHATKPRCRCRCGGTLHGARRTPDMTVLPLADPHYAVDQKNRQLEINTTDHT